jgi:ABC-2 type transport system permease protein
MPEPGRLPLQITLAVWRRAAAEGVWLLAGCALFLFAFFWLDIYLRCLVSASALTGLLADLPESMGGMFGISIAEVASPHGRVGVTFVHPIVVVVGAFWALTRGSDSVSGPLDRGTLEVTLAQPVSRMTVLGANIGVTLLGAALLALAAWLGTCAAIATVTVEQVHPLQKMIFQNENFLSRMLFSRQFVPLSTLVSNRDFIASAVNLFSLIALMAAYTTLISACDRFRWRTIGIAASFTLIQIVMKMAGLLAKHLEWLFHFTFLGAYWPQTLALTRDGAWQLAWRYNGILLGCAAGCYFAAAVVFRRRDLPAPL